MSSTMSTDVSFTALEAQYANHPAYLAYSFVREFGVRVDRRLREMANEMEEVKREMKRREELRRDVEELKRLNAGVDQQLEEVKREMKREMKRREELRRDVEELKRLNAGVDQQLEEVNRELRKRKRECGSPLPLSPQMRAKALERAKEPCSICYEDMTNPAVTPCGHVFCKGCIDAYCRVKGASPPCPLCRKKITSCSELSK